MRAVGAVRVAVGVAITVMATGVTTAMTAKVATEARAVAADRTGQHLPLSNSRRTRTVAMTPPFSPISSEWLLNLCRYATIEVGVLPGLYRF